MKNWIAPFLFVPLMTGCAMEEMEEEKPAFNLDLSFDAQFVASDLAGVDPKVPGAVQMLEMLVIAQAVKDKELVEPLVLSLRTLCHKESTPDSGSVTYPNRAIATYSAREVGTTYNYSDRTVITYDAGEKGGTYYYPNRKVYTYDAGEAGATYYYPNGKVISYDVGEIDGTWYWPNGRVVTYDAGVADATWYREDGSVWTHYGPELTEAQLSQPACLVNEIIKGKLPTARTCN